MHFLLFAAGTSLLERLNLDVLKARLDTYILRFGPDLLMNLCAAAIIFYLGRWAAKLAERILFQVLVGAKLDETLTKFLCRITYALMLCAVALASLDRLGVNTTSLTAVLAAAGLAVGMALQGSLSNFAAGVMIILFRPFKVGDFVEAGGTKGIVEEINVFSTLMRTPDNVDIVVPNNAITGGNITNYSSKPTRRIDMVVGCAYRDDLLAVKRFLEGVLHSDPRILRDPEPVVAVDALADHSVNFVVRPWVKNSDYWPVRWDLTERIKLGFDHHGFEIPFPQRDVHVYTQTSDGSEEQLADGNGEAADDKHPDVARLRVTGLDSDLSIAAAVGSEMFPPRAGQTSDGTLRPRRVA
jgi:small conductance mechanosensitive channel